jgi:RecA/RadA recombinase
MSALIERILKNSTIKATAILSKSKVFGKKEMLTTTVPMINVACSGSIDGGLLPGMLMLAGPSKHFKSAFALLLASAFMKSHPEGVVIFYDSEFGTPESYFDSFEIDKDRTIHVPIVNVEEFKFDIAAQLDGLTDKDKVFIVVDSIGNLASKKEAEDALEGKSVADMSRAKQLKSTFRIITPHLSLKNIPMVVVNHTYKELALFPRDVVSGGTGAYYSSDAIWIIGRQQDKDGKELSGYNFIINIEKSRHVKEKSKIPITVSFEGGIKKWSGMLELALEGNYIAKPKNGWYQRIDPKTGEFIGENMLREKNIINNTEFWIDLLKQTDFSTYISNKYTVAQGNIMQEEKIDLELDEDNE